MNKKPPKLSLSDLAALRDTLAKDAEIREAERQQAARQAKAAAADANVFRNSIGDITPISSKGAQNRATLSRRMPPPIARPMREDEAAARHESLSDEFDPEGLLEAGDRLSYRRPGIGREVLEKLERGAWGIQKQLDLHGMRREEAREALSAFLHDAVKRGLRCVRVIHGKGLGSLNQAPVLKDKVRGWLVQKEEVLAYCQAQGQDGGGGALIVLLQPKASARP